MENTGLTVLITGATGGFGRLLLLRLENDPAVSRIIGLSNEDVDDDNDEEIANTSDDKKFEYFLGDIRKKRVEEVFQQNSNIDVLVHLAYDNNPEHSQRSTEETNIFGTLRMIKLARKYGIKRFIYKSPTAVYGANPDNPSLIKEDFPLRGNRNFAAQRNKIEADMVCRMNMHPGLKPDIVILRCCGIMGEDIRSPLNTLFGKMLVPTVLGYDPMFQIMHQDDVTEALALSVVNDKASGVFNIAGKNTEPLSECIRRMGKFAAPLPSALLGTIYKAWFTEKSRHSFSFDLDYLKYSFAVDTRRAKEELGFTPGIM